MAIDLSFRKLPFRRALEWFLEKLLIPSETYEQLDRDQHNHGFIVAGLTNAQALNQMQEAVGQFIAEGQTLEEFRQQFDEIAQNAGWGYNGGSKWRSKIVALTNARTSYAAGRFEQQHDPETLRRRPFLQYRHGGSAEPRPLHIGTPPFGWNGLVLPADDPFWQTHYPPNGWGCSCFATSLSQRDLERLGKTQPDTAPQDGFDRVIDPISGQPRLVPRGVDAGWDYTPGRNPVQDRQRVYEAMLRRLPPELRTQAEQMIQQRTGEA